MPVEKKDPSFGSRFILPLVSIFATALGSSMWTRGGSSGARVEAPTRPVIGDGIWQMANGKPNKFRVRSSERRIGALFFRVGSIKRHRTNAEKQKWDGSAVTGLKPTVLMRDGQRWKRESGRE